MAITIALILVFSIYPTFLLADSHCDAQADIVFIMDSSGSVGQSDYEIMLDFIVNITRNFDVGINKVQFGAITFSSNAQTVFNLSTYSDHASLEQAILATPYDGGGTFTGKALELARTSSFTAASGARDGVPKIAIVFTDGQSGDPSDMQTQAAALKDAGVKVISIGIGSNIDQAELELIASSTQDVFEVTGFDVLDTINQQLTNKTCNLVKEACSCADITSRLKSVEQKLDAMEEKLDTLIELLKTQSSTQAHSDGYFDIMNTGNKEWRLAFRGTPYINKSVYEAYKSGTGAHSNPEPGCKQLDGTQPCQNHYRNNDVLDNWTNIDEVALVLYLGKTQVKHMTFDGQGSTYMDWLSQNRLKLSSWVDAKNETYTYFSIEGNSNHRRRFFINRNYGGCPKQAGWFVALDPGINCGREKQESFPVFKYSVGDTYTNWSNGDVGTASLMAILVKYKTGVIAG